MDNYNLYMKDRAGSKTCCCKGQKGLKGDVGVRGPQGNTGAQGPRGNPGNPCLPQYGPKDQPPQGIKPDCIGNIYVQGPNPQINDTVKIWVAYGTGVNDWHRIEAFTISSP